MKKLSCILTCVTPLLVAIAGEALAQSTSAPYLTASRYLDGGLLAGTISPAASGSSNFPAVRNTYDSYGRLQKVETGVLSSWQADTILPANWSGFSVLRVQSISYDADGRKIQDTFADGSGTVSNVIQYSYDAYNRLICTAVRMNPAVFGSLPADACTLGTQGSNGSDRITLNVYDALDRVIQVRRAVGTSLEQAYATYSYTVDGKQQDILDANGNHTLQIYDGHDRLATMQFPSPTGPSNYNPATQATALSTAGAANANDYEAYGYDANGNRTSLRKRDTSIIGYQYDALNRVTVKDLPGGTASDVYYDYDNRGLMLDAKFASLAGVGISYTYDFAGRKTSEVSYGQTVSYQYDNDGNRTRLTWPDGYYVSYGYDGLNRMQTATENGSTLLGTYSYDQLQRVAQIQYANPAYGASMGQSWSTWDDLLTLSDTMQGTNGVAFTDSYSPAHQIVQSSVSNPAYQYYPSFAGTMAYAPNGLNQYHVITPPGGSATTIGYDANANLTSDGTFSYGYDPENRLISASQTGMSATYLYDPQGRRRQKQVTGGSYAGTTQYLDAGDDEIADYDGSGTLLNRYVPGREVDRPIVMVPGTGEKRYFMFDKTGSVIAMVTTVAGRAQGPFTYDAYGNCVGGGAPCSGGVPFKYTGRRYDPETGIYYYRARYYSPAIGRFLQTDPIGYKDDLDLYTYVGNDPTDKTDPQGLEAGCITNGGGCGMNNPNALSNNLNAAANVLDAVSIGAMGAGPIGVEAGEVGEEGVAILRGAASELKAGSTIGENAANGRAFQQAVGKEQGLTSNTKTFSTSQGKTIPDFKKGADVGDAKNVGKLSNTRQMRAQRELATQNGGTHTVYVPSHTKVTQPMKESGTQIIRCTNDGKPC